MQAEAIEVTEYEPRRTMQTEGVEVTEYAPKRTAQRMSPELRQLLERTVDEAYQAGVEDGRGGTFGALVVWASMAGCNGFALGYFARDIWRAVRAFFGS